MVCTYTGLTSGIAEPVASSPEFFIANQTFGYWTAVGIRSLPGDDWDLELYKDIGADPACVDTFLAMSNLASGVDIVVGDFNFETPGARYLLATRFSGSGAASIEWDSGADIIFPNGGAVFGTTGPDDILEIWDVNLQGGVEYGIHLSWTGNADLRFVLFENPASDSYSMGRTAAILDSTSNATVTPGTSGWHGLVVVNENGGSADYRIEVGTCTLPIPLTSGVSQHLPAGFHHFSFDQTDAYWTALAVRTDIPGSEWLCFPYSNALGGSWPLCFTNSAGGSQGVGYEGRWITFTTLNFNSGGLGTGTYYASADPYSLDGSMARIEWDSGSDALGIGAAPVFRIIDSSDVIEIWDVYLNERTPYTAMVSMTGTAAPLAELIWQDPSHGTLALSLGLPTAGVGICESFVSDIGAWHGFAVLNFNGGSGTYGVSLAETFQDAADTLLQNPYNGRGCSWVDYDGDGDLDLHVTNANDPNRLFVNDGAGHFSDGTPPPLPFPANWLSSKWADYDNDGDADVAISSNYSRLALFRNENGAGFTDVTPAIFDSTYAGIQVSWIDYDNDGTLDIYLANGFDNRLFHGDGAGNFVDATPALVKTTTSRTGTWADLDDDGDLDLYCIGPGSNTLLRNDGGGTFTNVTTSPLDDPGHGYQAAAGDYDGDGDLDLYLANSAMPPIPNRLFRNDGSMAFTDVTPTALLDSTETRGAVWTDYDNDGNLDVLTTGGGGANRLIANNGTWLYEVFPSPLLNVDLMTAATWGDADGDGDLDLYLSKGTFLGPGLNQFVRNDLCKRHAWVNVDLQGVVSNRDGIGAKIFVHTLEGYKTTRWDMTTEGAEFGGAPLLAHFGIGQATVIDSVVVLWPSGVRQTLIAPAPYQTLNIVEDISSISVADEQGTPVKPMLHANMPNPFHGATKISFDLVEPGRAVLRVYDVGGRLVRTLVNESGLGAGTHEASWDGRNEEGTVIASGVYFYHLEAGDTKITRKMILIR